MIRLLVVDDHPIVRDGLRQILAKVPDIKIVDEVGTGEDALKKLRRKKYDIVILDVALPGIGGLEVLKRIGSRKHTIPVLMLSMYPEEHYAARTLQMGASGYLGKGNFSEEVITAIRAVAGGGKYVSRSLAATLNVDSVSARKKPPHETLSPREHQVMCMIATGKTTGVIAKELSLSVKTIETYRAHILEKLDLRNNVGIARYALECRLIF